MAKPLEHDGQGGSREFQPVTSSSGAGDAEKLVQTDASGRLDASVMPVGIGADTANLEASEDISAGEFVNIYDNASVPMMRLADATTAGREVHGFVLAGVSTGANGDVYFEGTNTQLSGLAPGTNQFLDTTAGQATGTPPSGSGNIVQKLGRAISASALAFEASNPIELV